MDIPIPFGGQALNAVDKKGRVSLPAEFRSVVERRCAIAKAADLPVDDKLLHIAEDEMLPCLVGFDETEQFRLAAELAQADTEADRGGRRGVISRGAGTATFGPLQPAVFDKAGRMVINGLMRDVAEIDDFAFFVGTGPNFDIWSPRHAYAHYSAIKENRMLRLLDYLCASKGVKL